MTSASATSRFLPRATEAATRKRLLAFVDETGDRGHSVKASPFFSMATVLIPEEDYRSLSAAVISLKQTFKVPKERPLHWSDHVKVFPRRQLVTRELSRLPSLVVNYVIFEKAGMSVSPYLRSDQEAFYNYTAGFTMERLLLAAGFWPGGARDVKVTFGHVRGFQHSKTLDYFQIKKERNQGPANWALLEGTPTFAATNGSSGLQAADQYAGILSAAMVPDQYGGYEPHHLMAIRRQIRRNSAGSCWNYGFKVMARPNTFESYPWWPPEGL